MIDLALPWVCWTSGRGRRPERPMSRADLRWPSNGPDTDRQAASVLGQKPTVSVRNVHFAARLSKTLNAPPGCFLLTMTMATGAHYKEKI